MREVNLDAETLGVIAAIGNMLLSGIVTVIIKAQSKDLKPAGLLLIQTVVSSISFLIIVAAMGDFMLMFTIGWNALLPLISAAIMGIIIGNLLYFASLQLIGVSKAYPIAMTYPLLTYVLEVAFFPDVSFEWLKLLGIAIVIIGVVFISLSKVNGENSKSKMALSDATENELDNNESTTDIKLVETKSEIVDSAIDISIKKSSPFKSKLVLGIILSIISAVTWATGTTLIRYGLEQTDVNIITLNGARMAFLVPISLVIFFSMNRGKNKSKFTWKNVSFVAIAALLGLVAANIIYLFAVDTIGSSTPAVIAASGPLIATPLSILFLKEKVDWKIILGTFLTIGGIALILLL